VDSSGGPDSYGMKREACSFATSSGYSTAAETFRRSSKIFEGMWTTLSRFLPQSAGEELCLAVQASAFGTENCRGASLSVPAPQGHVDARIDRADEDSQRDLGITRERGWVHDWNNVVPDEPSRVS
jgi:hypothetical protein